MIKNNNNTLGLTINTPRIYNNGDRIFNTKKYIQNV